MEENKFYCPHCGALMPCTQDPAGEKMQCAQCLETAVPVPADALYKDSFLVKILHFCGWTFGIFAMTVAASIVYKGDDLRLLFIPFFLVVSTILVFALAACIERLDRNSFTAAINSAKILAMLQKKDK